MVEGKTFLISGSSGFLGSHLTSKIRQLGGKVIEVDILKGIDLLKWEDVANIEKFDVMFHLAAKTFVPDSYVHPREFYSLNLQTTIHAAELCRLNNARLIYLSSYVYGQPEYLPIDEAHPVVGFNPYAHSKILCEQICEGYYKHFQLPVIIVRPFNIYGPGQKSHFLIPSLIEQVRNKKIVVKDLKPRRDFVHVYDVVEALLAAAQYSDSHFQIFNLGSGRSYSVKEIIDILLEQIDHSVEIVSLNEPRPSEIWETVADITKAKNLLGWQPTIPLEKGVRELLMSNE